MFTDRNLDLQKQKSFGKMEVFTPRMLYQGRRSLSLCTYDIAELAVGTSGIRAECGTENRREEGKRVDGAKETRSCILFSHAPRISFFFFFGGTAQFYYCMRACSNKELF